MNAGVTQLLIQASEGDSAAVDALFPVLYRELRRIAGGQMKRERSDCTLQATALVHEAYLELVHQRQANWQNRAHFLAISAHVMRRILRDHARDRRAQKRDGGWQRVSLAEGLLAGEAVPEDVLALDAVLEKLELIDPRQAKVVELRFYGGLSVEETAEVMKIGTATVKREWAVAKAWLKRELAAAKPAPA